MNLLNFLKELKKDEEKYLKELTEKQKKGSIIAQGSFNDTRWRINNLENMLKSKYIHLNRYLLDKIMLNIDEKKYNTKIFSDLNNLDGKSFSIDEIQKTVIDENFIW